MRPMIAGINDLEPQMQQLSDEELAGKTSEFKQNGWPMATSLDDLLSGSLRGRPRSRTARAQHAALRCPVDRRIVLHQRQNRRNEDR